MKPIGAALEFEEQIALEGMYILLSPGQHTHQSNEGGQCFQESQPAGEYSENLVDRGTAHQYFKAVRERVLGTPRLQHWSRWLEEKLQ